MASLSDEIEWAAAVLSHVTRNENQWKLFKLAATEGVFTHSRAKAVLELSSGGLKGPLDALLDAAILDRDESGYRLTPWGEFAHRLLERGSSPAVSDLRGSHLVLANRPKNVDPRELVSLLEPATTSLIGTSGPYRYIAVCDGDPDMVEDLLFGIQQLGATGISLTVTKVA